jgi:hypothetical protein
MATNLLRGGFHPRRGIGAVPRPRRYEVASGYGTALFPGDAVTLVTAGVIQSAAAASGTVLGVIAHVSYWSGTGRIYGQYIPASTTYTPTARGSYQASYAYVWDDPSIEYIAPVDVATTAALNYAGLGANMNLKVSDAGSTVYGRSGHKLDGTYVAGDAQFRITEMLRMSANDLTLQYQLVACRINDGFDPFLSNAGI